MTHRYAVAAALQRGQSGRQILSRHRSAQAAERAAAEQNAWGAAHGYAPSEAVCLDDDGDITATVAECRAAGTL